VPAGLGGSAGEVPTFDGAAALLAAGVVDDEDADVAAADGDDVAVGVLGLPNCTLPAVNGVTAIGLPGVTTAGLAPTPEVGVVGAAAGAPLAALDESPPVLPLGDTSPGFAGGLDAPDTGGLIAAPPAKPATPAALVGDSAPASSVVDGFGG
jgi:hypothetical protein